MRLSYRPLILASFAAIGIGFVAAACAEEKSTEQDPAAPVRAAAKEYLAAISRGDVDAVRKMWTPDGDYVDAAGKTYKVREMLAHRDTKMPRDTERNNAATPESTIHFAAPDVAIEDAVCSGGVTDDGDELACRYTVIWVKRDGQWLLDSVREAAVAVPSSGDHLAALDWLIGEWAGTTEGGALLVSSHWSHDGHFIIREFAELARGGGAISSTQRIGWDAATDKIKCWTFDSQGGSGEGTWRQDGKRWIVQITDSLPNGEKATTSAAYSPVEAGRYVWETTGAKIAGQNVSPRRVEFKRATDR